MRKFFKSLLVYFFVLFFVLTIFNKGFVLPSESFYLIATYLVLTLTIMISDPVLKFLTVKAKFLTHFLMSSILLTGVIYLLKLFMVGLFINEYTFEGVMLGTLQLNSFIVTPWLTIVAISILTSLICSIYREIDSV